MVEELVGEVHDAVEAVQPSIQDTPDGRKPRQHILSLYGNLTGLAF